MTATLPGAEVLSKLGHELRGPLNGIVGLVRVMLLKLAAGPVDPAQQTHYLTLVQASADQLTATVERVVELARLETAPAAPDGELTDCRELVAEVVARYRAPRLHADVPDQPAFLPGTPDRLRRLLSELVDNALKHAGAAEVRVRVRPAAIDVVDDGPGIPEADQQRIFEPFERGPSAAPGTGLGLCLARQLAARCGLRITLHSTPGRGSTFSVQRTAS